MAKYKLNEVKIGVPMYYGEYTTKKHRQLCSSVISYAKRHDWADFTTRKDKENGQLMLIRLK